MALNNLELSINYPADALHVQLPKAAANNWAAHPSIHPSPLVRKRGLVLAPRRPIS